MRNDVNNLYVAIKDNFVIIFDTNLKKFVSKLSEIEPEIRNYDYYYRKFKKEPVLYYTLGDKKYVLQKVL